MAQETARCTRGLITLDYDCTDDAENSAPRSLTKPSFATRQQHHAASVDALSVNVGGIASLRAPFDVSVDASEPIGDDYGRAQFAALSPLGETLVVLEMCGRRRELRAALVMCPKNHS